MCVCVHVCVRVCVRGEGGCPWYALKPALLREMDEFWKMPHGHMSESCEDSRSGEMNQNLLAHTPRSGMPFIIILFVTNHFIDFFSQFKTMQEIFIFIIEM